MIRSIHPAVRLMLLIALALGMALPAAAQSDECRADVDYASRAEASLAEGQYESAANAYSCLIENDPENYEALLGRATAVIYAAAVRGEIDFNVSPDLHPVYDEAYDLITDAIARASDAIQADPTDLEARALRGYLYWYTGQNQNALADFDAILRQDDGNVFAYLFRGAANQYLGNEAKAEADFENAIELTNDRPGALGQVGAMYANTGYPERGIEYYTQAIELAPDNPTFYLYRAYTYSDMGDSEAAIADYTSAIEIDPDNPNTYLNRAFEYEQLSDPASAAADYASAIELDPENALNYQLLGWAYIDMAEYTDAVTQFDQALALDPSDLWSFLGRGTAQSELGSLALGARDFESYVELAEAYRTDAETMKPGRSQMLEVSEGQVYVIPLNAEAGGTIDIEATAQSLDFDPMFVLIGPDGEPVAGSDDIRSGDLNSAVRNLELTQTGRYTLLVTHAGGGSYGDVEVNVILVGATTAQVPTTSTTGELTCDSADFSDRAFTFIDEGDYESALVMWDCAIEANPEDAELYIHRGLTGLMLGPNRAAFDDIDTAELINPNIVDEEIDALTEIIAAFPEDLFSLVSRSYLLWSQALDDSAMFDYEAALALDPDNLTAILFRGSSHQYMGNVADADADFARYLELDPDNPSGLSVIIYSYFGTGDDEIGLEYVDRLLELEPDNALMIVERALAFSRLQDFDTAAAEMNRAIELEPDVATHYEDLGWIYLRAQNAQAAADAFENALGLDDTLQFSVLGLATARTQLGDTAEGAQHFAEYVDMIELNALDGQIVNGSGTLVFNDGDVYRLPLILNAGQTIDIEVVSTTGDVDPMVLLVGPDGTPLAGNDDIDILTDYNAGIQGFAVTEDGTYTLVVSHSGAGSSGEVEVTVSGLDEPALTPTKNK